MKIHEYIPCHNLFSFFNSHEQTHTCLSLLLSCWAVLSCSWLVTLSLENSRKNPSFSSFEEPIFPSNALWISSSSFSKVLHTSLDLLSSPAKKKFQTLRYHPNTTLIYINSYSHFKQNIFLLRKCLNAENYHITVSRLTKTKKTPFNAIWFNLPSEVWDESSDSLGRSHSL